MPPAASDEQLTGRVGEPVHVYPESTPGTGAIWYAPAAPPASTIESLDAIPADPGMGGAVLQDFVFTADAPGTYTLDFRLKREWEPVVRGERRVVIQVGPEAP